MVPARSPPGRDEPSDRSPLESRSPPGVLRAPHRLPVVNPGWAPKNCGARAPHAGLPEGHANRRLREVDETVGTFVRIERDDVPAAFADALSPHQMAPTT